MSKNLRILIVLVMEVLIVALLVVVSQRLAARQKENTPPETYVYHNVYFEYPGDWEVTLNESAASGELAVTPSPGSPEAQMFGTFHIMFLPNIALENWEQTLATDLTCSGRTNTLWYRIVDNGSFSGFECVWQLPEEKYPYWQFFLYNENDQMGFAILATPLNDAAVEPLSSLETAEGTFPDILHIAESVRIPER
ncbi:MAG: hypothetical protein HYU84_05520 [Chloroflexi bacterium]|nr:hypothetical protein [Chloroflexota bacterium]